MLVRSPVRSRWEGDGGWARRVQLLVEGVGRGGACRLRRCAVVGVTPAGNHQAVQAEGTREEEAALLAAAGRRVCKAKTSWHAYWANQGYHLINLVSCHVPYNHPAAGNKWWTGQILLAQRHHNPYRQRQRRAHHDWLCLLDRRQLTPGPAPGAGWQQFSWW